jgi:hypothetical protein
MANQLQPKLRILLCPVQRPTDSRRHNSKQAPPLAQFIPRLRVLPGCGTERSTLVKVSAIHRDHSETLCISTLALLPADLVGAEMMKASTVGTHRFLRRGNFLNPRNGHAPRPGTIRNKSIEDCLRL